MKFAQLVMGPAGTGKSTYCRTMQEHCSALGRSMNVINLDPAADAFGYTVELGVPLLLLLLCDHDDDDVADAVICVHLCGNM